MDTYRKRRRSLWVVLAVLRSAAAWAQLGISPLVLEPSAVRGSSTSLTVQVTNAGSASLACSVAVTGLDMSSGVATGAADAPRSLESWTEVGPKSFDVGPKETVPLTIRLRVPKDASGGYYGVLAVNGQPAAPATTGGLAAMRLSFRAEAVLLLSVQGGSPKPELVLGDPVLDSPGATDLEIKVPVENRGNLHARAALTAQVQNEGGQTLDSLQLLAGGGYVLPGQPRLFAGRQRMALPDGVYRLVLELAAKGQPGLRRSTVPFTIRSGTATVQAITDAVRESFRNDGFAVRPRTLALQLSPGSRRLATVELVNISDHALRLRARVTEWTRCPDGHDEVGDAPPEHGRSARSLISLRGGDLELPAQGRQRVPITALLPAGAEGARYAAVLFETADRPSAATPTQGAANSVLLDLSPPSAAAPQLEVGEPRMERLPSGRVTFAASLRNAGSCSATADATFQLLLHTAGKAVSVLEVGAQGRVYVQAGMARSLISDPVAAIAAGTYTLGISVTADGAARPTSRETSIRIEEPIGATTPN